MWKLITWCALLLSIALVEAAMGAEPIRSLAIETIAEQRVFNAATARVEFSPATRLKLGDEIFYTVRVRNTTDMPLRDVVVIKEVPRNTLYVADSAIGPAATVTFSVDGGIHYASEGDLVVSGLSGTTRVAKPADYTHIRWQLRHALAPGATALLRFRGTFH